MNKKTTIRKLLAFILLAIFAMSTTPIKFLHQLFANHSDVIIATSMNDSPRLHVSGIDCHCNSLVVSNPYTYDGGTQPEGIPPLFIRYTVKKRPGISSPQLFFFRLRGPPSFA